MEARVFNNVVLACSICWVQLYGVYKIKNLSVGLSVNNPFGLGAKWDDKWEGRYVSQEVELQTFYIQPTVAYQINDKFGFGAGFVYCTGSATVRKAAQAINDDVNVTLEGKGSGYGFNLGVFVKPMEKLGIGLSDRSGVKVDLKDGDATLTGIPSSLSSQLPATSKFNSNLNLPVVISFGASFKVTAKLLVTCRLDVILMDGQMPLVDGYETTRRIREQERSGLRPQRIAIVAVTGNVAERELARESGMDDFLAIPYSQGALRDVLIRHRPKMRSSRVVRDSAT